MWERSLFFVFEAVTSAGLPCIKYIRGMGAGQPLDLVGRSLSFWFFHATLFPWWTFTLKIDFSVELFVI